MSSFQRLVALVLLTTSMLSACVALPGFNSQKYAVVPYGMDIQGKHEDWYYTTEVDPLRRTELRLAFVNSKPSPGALEATISLGYSEATGQRAWVSLKNARYGYYSKNYALLQVRVDDKPIKVFNLALSANGRDTAFVMDLADFHQYIKGGTRVVIEIDDLITLPGTGKQATFSINGLVW